MFKKILLAEDIDTISQGIMSLMTTLDVAEVDQSQYCDDAFLKIKKSYLDGFPFELLITDLSFAPDHRKQSLESGEALVKKVKRKYPDLKIIVYSIDARPEKVRYLINEIGIDGYVLKGRRGLRELEDAIMSVLQHQQYLSPEMSQSLRTKSPVEISDLDIEILKMLSQGHSQETISIYLKNKNIKPSSLSAIEKRLNILKNHFQAQNVVHLVAIAKDLGLI